MILSCQNISKAFDGKEIIKDANFHIEDYEKAAIVGINGAGKTTLLNMITGKVTPDDGMVALSKGKTLGYLEQHPILNSDNTIYDELMSVKAYLVDLEKQIRNAEKEMQHKDGEELEQLMNTPPARKVVLALACDPLDNHEIAFGVARFALHLFSQRCVRRWGRYCPRLHVARRRHFGASPLRQRSLFRRKIAHPSAYAGAWPGSEYLHSGPCTRLCGVCTIPPLSESPAPRLMHLVRPRY